MPTLNQRKAVRETIENLRKGKKVSIGKILVKNGYGKSMQTNPQVVTRSKGWQELMEEMLPDDLLAAVHTKVLKKKEKIVVGIGKGYSEVVDTGQPHSDALKAAELAYKLKGRLVTKTDVTSDGKPIIIQLPEALVKKNGIPSGPEPNSSGHP